MVIKSIHMGGRGGLGWQSSKEGVEKSAIVLIVFMSLLFTSFHSLPCELLYAKIGIIMFIELLMLVYFYHCIHLFPAYYVANQWIINNKHHKSTGFCVSDIPTKDIIQWNNWNETFRKEYCTILCIVHRKMCIRVHLKPYTDNTHLLNMNPLHHSSNILIWEEWYWLHDWTQIIRKYWHIYTPLNFKRYMSL